MGDDRPDCIELDPQDRDRLVCLYPEETCEATSVESPWILGEYMIDHHKERLLFAP